MIAGANVTVPASAMKVDPGWNENAIENGGPDGIAMIDNTTHGQDTDNANTDWKLCTVLSVGAANP